MLFPFTHSGTNWFDYTAKPPPPQLLFVESAGEYRTKRASLPRQAQHERFRFQIIARPLRNAMQKLLKDCFITVLEILHVRKIVLILSGVSGKFFSDHSGISSG